MIQNTEISNKDIWDFSRITHATNSWQYDKYVRTFIMGVLEYKFIWKFYDMSFPELRQLATSQAEIPEWLALILDTLDESRVNQSVFRFLEIVASHGKAEAFCQQTETPPDSLMKLILIVKNILPEKIPLRKLIDETHPKAFDYFMVFKLHNYANNLILLEKGRTKEGRTILAEEMGLPEVVVLDFVRRSDLARLQMASGYVRRLWAIGCNSLEKLRQADPSILKETMDAYYRSVGKDESGEMVIHNYTSLIENAKIMIDIVEE